MPKILVPILAVIASVFTQVGTPDTRVTIPAERWVLVGDFRRPARSVADRGDGSPAVLLLHGAARDRRSYGPLAAALAHRGIASLRIDLRGEGESTNLGRFTPEQSANLVSGAERDIAAALAWLRTRPGIDAARIGVVGASYSGEAMAAAARAGARANAYVALSPGNFSEESARAIDPSGRPWWFIASEDERAGLWAVQQAARLSQTLRTTMVHGTSHATDILSAHAVLDAEIADWFASKLENRSSPALWGNLPTGSYGVGFASETSGAGANAVNVDIWYPAQHRATVALTFGDYLGMAPDLRGAAAGFPATPGSVMTTLAISVSSDPSGVPRETLDRILLSPMAARRDSPPAGGRHPLVLWTPRYGTTAAQSVLSEYLAAHGFVVAVARPAVTSVKMPFELSTLVDKRAELDARVADMRTALALFEQKAYVDTAAIGVLAWSYAGEMATAFQQNEPRVTLVAGLSTPLVDGWVFQDSAAAAALDPVKLTAAYAVLRERAGEPTVRPAVFDQMRASYLVEFPGLAHGSFNALEGYLPSLLGIDTVQRWSHSGPGGVSGYEAAATILTRLLRHHVAAKIANPLWRLQVMTGIPPETAVLSWWGRTPG